jgi:hypothetical protein
MVEYINRIWKVIPVGLGVVLKTKRWQTLVAFDSSTFRQIYVPIVKWIITTCYERVSPGSNPGRDTNTELEQVWSYMHSFEARDN